MPKHDGFTVQVRTAGNKRHEEHRTSVENSGLPHGTTVVSCWIASIESQAFCICWEVSPASATHMVVKVYMDGQLAEAVSHHKKENSGVSRGVIVDQGHLRRYMFGKIPLADHETVTGLRPGHSDLGTISVHLYRVSHWKRGPHPESDGSELFEVEDAPTIHEDDAGDVEHVVCFAEQERQRPNASGYTVHYPTKIDEKPFIIFKFYYRPEAVLARLGIVIRRVDTPASGSGRKRSRTALKATSLTNPKRSRIETSVAGSSSSIRRRRSRSPTVPSTPERAEPNSLQNAVLLYPEPEGEGNSGLTGEEQILKDNIKQEEIEKLDGIIADAISRKEQLMRQSMKREGSPIQVPRDCGIIDLT